MFVCCVYQKGLNSHVTQERSKLNIFENVEIFDNAPIQERKRKKQRLKEELHNPYQIRNFWKNNYWIVKK